jgi:hypothetical protein
MTGILISMVSAGVVCAVGEEILVNLGKGEMAKWVRVGGGSLVAGLGVGLVIKLIGTVKKSFGA